MKIYWLTFALMGLLMACGGENSEQNTQEETVASESAPASKPKNTLVFLDKSLSVNEDAAYVEKKYTKVLTDLVQKDINGAGDKIEVWLIHENTAKGKALELTSRTALEATEGMSQTDVEAAQTNYDFSLQKERLNFTKQILSQLATPNESRSNKQTDIQASLQAIGTVASKGEPVEVYYFSDMVESMSQKSRRDFHHTPPKTTAQADEWAKADALGLKSQYPNLTGVAVHMVLPFEPTTSSKINNPNITQYWKTFFTELGVKSVREEI